MDTNYLCYEDFGAKGDGKTDDFEAIIACHEEANRTGAYVKTRDEATYYIGGKALSAIIKTDVDFGTSKFIIDDTNLENKDVNIFIVSSDFNSYNISIPSLSKNQKRIDIPHEGENLYVRVFNDNHKIFIREGLNMNSGAPTSDCFAVDANGNISPSINWDYTEVTRAYAKCTDDKPITIKGGIFTTIANQAQSFYNYHRRGISIQRSHVTIDNITHYITGECEHGAPYGGFIRTNEVVDVTLKNSLLTPHFTYQTASKIPGKSVSMGSYDINFSASIDIKCLNVTQTIDIMDKRYWGIYTSNFCKNLYLENCTLSRFDAHQGVTNVTIKGCKLGHQCLNLIGFGEAVIEDTYAFGKSFVALRPDYGSIWDGNITIKRCKWQPASDKIDVILSSCHGNHNFGYPCTMPHNIVIDGLEILDGNFEDVNIYILPNYDKEFSKDKPFPYGTPDKLSIKNIVTESGRNYNIYRDPSLYEGLTVEEN